LNLPADDKGSVTDGEMVEEAEGRARSPRRKSLSLIEDEGYDKPPLYAACT
jgi:hypothetical protein